MEIPTIALVVIGIIGTTATVGGVCFKIGKNGNGNGKHSKSHNEIYKQINDKVEIEECHRGQDNLKSHIDTRFNATDKRIDDVKELIKSNGTS